MLTGTQNLIITLCSMGLTSLIMVFFENTIYVDWDSQLIITSCWLGLTSLIMIFKKRYILCWLGLTTSSLLYIDLYSHLWSWYLKKNIFYVDWEWDIIFNVITFYVDWDSQHHDHGIILNYNTYWLGLTIHHYFILTWTHIFDLDIF